jgi:hypothetical protein
LPAACPRAGGTYQNFGCSNGQMPACDTGLNWNSQYDICVKNLFEPICPAYYALNTTSRPFGCAPQCPSIAGTRRVAKAADGATTAYCASADVGYDTAANAAFCFATPPPMPPAMPGPPIKCARRVPRRASCERGARVVRAWCARRLLLSAALRVGRWPAGTRRPPRR